MKTLANRPLTPLQPPLTFRELTVSATPAMSQLDALTALSPLDGRYSDKVTGLRPLLSEAGFMKHRVEVEIAWLIGLSDLGMKELPAFSAQARTRLGQWVAEFSAADAARIKTIEATTNHDVKAVEYWLKEKAAAEKALPELSAAAELIHFA